MRPGLRGGAALELLLWTAAAGAVAAGAKATRWTPERPAERASIATMAPLASTPDAAALARWRERVIASDPFRLLRHASPVAFAIAAPEQVPGAMPMMRPPKPVLVLRGVVGGPPWEAVLDGVPGRERGVVVRAGDVLAGPATPGAAPGATAGAVPGGAALRVRQVNATGVVITGMDTTWRLTVGDAATRARRAP